MSSMHILKQFDKAQLFRLFIDGRFHKKSKYDGWVGYEGREKGSVQAMLNGFAFMLDHFHQSYRINCAYLRALHRVCMLHVETTNDKSAPGDIRYQNTGLPFFVKTTTFENIEEFLQMRRDDGTVMFHDRELRKTANQLSADEVFKVLQTKGKLLYRGWYPNLDSETERALENPDSLHEFYSAKHYVQMAIIHKMEAIVERYHRKMAMATSPDDKIEAIALVVRELEILHPFTDGNCRVFAGVLMNQLLLYHGFPPVIVNNPNLDFEYSLAQWIGEIKQGMQNTETLLADPTATVFDYSILEMDGTNKTRFLEMAAGLIAKIDQYREMFLTPARLGDYTGGKWINGDLSVRYSGVGTHNSFQAGDLYFALTLAEWQSEGKDVAAELQKRVAAGVKGIVLSDEKYARQLGIPVLVVPDVMKAFTLAAYHTRQEANPKTVLITGTEGKTGTKIQLHHLLKSMTGVHAWLSSANTVIPIHKSLASLDISERVELNEVSVDADTEKTAQRSQVVNPDICFFSNISAEHMHVHKTLEGVVRNKSFVVTGLRQGGKCVMSSRMETYPMLVREVKERRPDIEILTFGQTEYDAGRLIACHFDNTEMGWQVHANILGEEVRYFTPLFQSYAPLMSVGVLLVVKLLGFDLQQVAKNYLDLKPYESMGQLYRIPIDGGHFLFYDQSRRASISGVRSVFQDIEQFNVPGRVIALYGSISSIKDHDWTRAYHKELAELIGKSPVKRLYTTGPNMEEVPGNLPDPTVFVKHSNDFNQLHNDILADLEPGGLLLIQGYLRLNLSEIADRIVAFKDTGQGDRHFLYRIFTQCSAEEVYGALQQVKSLESGAGKEIAANSEFEESLLRQQKSGNLTYRNLRARLLERFFSRLDEHLETVFEFRCINSAMLHSGLKVLVHNEDYCTQWFNNLDKVAELPKKILFGSFFDIGMPGLVMQVLVGTTNLHIGILKCDLLDGKYAITPMVESDFNAIAAKFNDPLKPHPLLEKRDWGHKWMTIDCGPFIDIADLQVFSAMFDLAGSTLYQNCFSPLLTLLAKNKLKES